MRKITGVVHSREKINCLGSLPAWKTSHQLRTFGAMESSQKPLISLPLENTLAIVFRDRDNVLVIHLHCIVSLVIKLNNSF